MSKPKYQPEMIENKLIQQWQEEGVYKTDKSSDKSNKKYVLSMFPYPSGVGLHTGHARIYTGTDVLARYYRMMGFETLHPMGWDAFGLPAENAAIKLKKNPKELVPKNIQNFKRQMNMLGLSYDWDREINTTDPSYYKTTQKLFILFYKHGLLYKKDTPVYYCESCKTGLAQEEVVGDGTHERCGNVVTKRNLPQWIFRITKYAQSLLDGLDGLDWPRGILEMQKNWVGKKKGINITYEIEGTDNTVTCFTTRPDTNFGATFVVLSPEHQISEGILSKNITVQDKTFEKVKSYVEKSLRKTERERMADEKTKTGVFTGLFAINNLNGKKLPIWISDFVLANVGTGAVVGVPGHDKRDFEFAQAFDLPIERVVIGPDGDTSEITRVEQVQEEEGKMVNSEFLNDREITDAIEVMMKHMEEKKLGKRETSYHLRDWIFSRQRYWGEPIPMVFCQKCADKKITYWSSEKYDKSDLRLNKGPQNNSFQTMIDEIDEKMSGWFPIDENELPLELPDVDSYEPSDTGESPLAHEKDWVKVVCPSCSGEARRETDTMPNWAGSSWYFLQFAANNQQSFDFRDQGVKDWLPVDWYVGGAEHAVLHLLYARFWMHALNDMGKISFREPFKALRNVGMVLAEDGRKMSKSWGNVVNPDDVVKEFGADAIRVYEMFMAPFSQEVAWSVQTLQGSYRFVKRIWHIYHDSAKVTILPKDASSELASELQRVISKITHDIPNVKFNTPIAGMMEFLNLWEKEGNALLDSQAKELLKMISVFAPFVSDHIWREVFNEQQSIHLQKWPTVDESLILEKDVIIPIQVNGKVRDQLSVSPSEIDEDSVSKKALASEKIQKWMGNKEYKIIYIKGKILNIVLPS